MTNPMNGLLNDQQDSVQDDALVMALDEEFDDDIFTQLLQAEKKYMDELEPVGMADESAKLNQGLFVQRWLISVDELMQRIKYLEGMNARKDSDKENLQQQLCAREGEITIVRQIVKKASLSA